MAEARLRASSEQAASSGLMVAELQNELVAIGDGLPEAISKSASQLAELREAIEAQRLQRQEASNAAALAVEDRLKSLREDLASEVASVGCMKEMATQRLSEQIEEQRAMLSEETAQRKSRHVALTEVVHRLQASLEVSAEMTEPSRGQLHSTPRTPVNATLGATTPPAPVGLPGQEGPRIGRSGLWGGATPVSGGSRSGTPQRKLPAPPTITTQA